MTKMPKINLYNHSSNYSWELLVRHPPSQSAPSRCSGLPPPGPTVTSSPLPAPATAPFLQCGLTGGWEGAGFSGLRWFRRVQTLDSGSLSFPDQCHRPGHTHTCSLTWPKRWLHLLAPLKCTFFLSLCHFRFGHIIGASTCSLT